MAQARVRPILEEVREDEPAPADFGDPVADYVAMWLALDVFHEQGRMTEEGWAFLVEHLQRPLELRLMEAKPSTSTGSLRALNLACHLMRGIEQESDPGRRAWYRRLCHHLTNGARDTLTMRLERPGRGRWTEGSE